MLQAIVSRLFPARPRRGAATRSGEPRLQLGVAAAMRHQAVDLSLADARKHILMTGATGSGVQLAVESLLFQQTRLGFGYVILDSGPDYGLRDRLYAAALAAGRSDEFVVVDFDKPEHSHTVDVLEGSPDIVASELLQLLPATDNNPGADYYRQVANYALTVILGAFQATGLKYTLLDVVAAMSNASAMEALVFALPEEGEPARLLNVFLDQYRQGNGDLDMFKIRDQLGGMAGRIALLAMGKLGQVLSAETPELSLADVVTSNKLCYIVLPVMGKCATAISLGRLFASKLLHLVNERAALPNRLRGQPTMFVFDSLDVYAPAGLEAAFSQARAAGVCLVAPLHSSALARLDPYVKEVLVGNTWTKLFFRQATFEDGCEAEKLIGTEPPGGPTAVYSGKILQHMPLGHFAALQGSEHTLAMVPPVEQAESEPYRKATRRPQPDSRAAIQLTRFIAEVGRE